MHTGKDRAGRFESIRQNPIVASLLAAGVALVIYGFVCRWAELYFFWESRFIGWVLILMAVIGLLYNRIRRKARAGQKSLPEKIGLGIVAFVVLTHGILALVLPFTDAYAAAKSHVRESADLISELGELSGFGLLPYGAVQKTTEGAEEYGSATIQLIVKGEKRYKDITVVLVKHPVDTDWQLVELR